PFFKYFLHLRLGQRSILVGIDGRKKCRPQKSRRPKSTTAKTAASRTAAESSTARPAASRSLTTASTTALLSTPTLRTTTASTRPRCRHIPRLPAHPACAWAATLSPHRAATPPSPAHFPCSCRE